MLVSQDPITALDRVLLPHRPRLLAYGVGDEWAAEAGLTCAKRGFLKSR
jgi:hypothetical protein